MRALLLAIVMVAPACSRAPLRKELPPQGATRARPPPPALDAITLRDFARRELWSWTSEKGLAALRAGGPILRAQVHAHPPDDAWYDVDVRETEDQELRAMLGAPPFDRVRYAWLNPWGAIDGVDDERYGDRPIRIVLREDAIVARFVSARTAAGARDETNPFRFGLPEWSFFDLEGHEVPRAQALAERGRIGAVLHVVTHREGDRFRGYREVVLVQASTIDRVEIAGEPLREGLLRARTTVAALARSQVVPAWRADDDAFLSRHVLVRWGALAPADLDAEERWLLTLPFPRSRYRALPRLAHLLAHAEQTLPSLVTGPPPVTAP